MYLTLRQHTFLLNDIEHKQQQRHTMISAGIPVLMAILTRRPLNSSLPSGQVSSLA